ncbi:hypothetical protein BDR22DRAFT_177316 [Usnea florida]
MSKKNHSGEDCVKKYMSGGQKRKSIKKLKRAELNMESDRRETDAKMRNSRASRVHQITRQPGRGGLSAPGAEQLRQYFSKKVPKYEKLSIGAMDPTASMTVLHMAAEEVETAQLTYGELRQVAGETMMVCGGWVNEAAVKVGNGEVEEVTQGGKAMKFKGDVGSEEDGMVEEDGMLEDDGMVEEDWEQGGVALAKDY